MRQGGEAGRQPHVAERVVDVFDPRSGADETGAELVGLAELEAHVRRRALERLVRDALGEQREAPSRRP